MFFRLPLLLCLTPHCWLGRKFWPGALQLVNSHDLLSTNHHHAASQESEKLVVVFIHFNFLIIIIIAHYALVCDWCCQMWAKQFWNLFFLYFSNKQISQSVFSNLLSAASSCEVRRTTSTIVHSLIAHKHLSTPTCAVLCCSFFFFFFSCAAVSCVYCSVAQGWLLSVVLILPCPPLPSGSIGSNYTQQLQSFIFIYFSPLNSFFFFS